ncbi:hypothetical protein B0H11DRAFT_1932864, partial [Mycena galericulata]
MCMNQYYWENVESFCVNTHLILNAGMALTPQPFTLWHRGNFPYNMAYRRNTRNNPFVGGRNQGRGVALHENGPAPSSASVRPRSPSRNRTSLEAGIDEAARRARAAGLTSMIDMVQARIRELDHATSTPANVAAARRTQAREARAATVSPLYRGLGANPRPIQTNSEPRWLWLEHDWGCPECSLKMSHAPFRHHAEEASIVAAYPNWRDESRVEYRWDGLFVLKTDSRRRGVNDEFGRRDAVLGPTSRLPNRAAKRFALLSHVPRLSHSPNGVSLECLCVLICFWPGILPCGARNDLQQLFLQNNSIVFGTASNLETLLHHFSRVRPWDGTPTHATTSSTLTTETGPMNRQRRHSPPTSACISLPMGVGARRIAQCRPQKTRVQPSDLDDSYAQWIPVPDDGYDDMVDRDSDSNPLNAVGSTPRHPGHKEAQGIRELHALTARQHTEGVPKFQMSRLRPASSMQTMLPVASSSNASAYNKDHADNLAQLLRNAWYPASVTDPGTCATFKTLEAYRLYNVVGNMNVNDFIHAMERATDVTAATGIRWLPDRYKQFQRMARQWAFLKRMKRAGRVHDPAGVDETKLGECAVQCWALSSRWEESPLELARCGPEIQVLKEGLRRFLYMLLLAVDANFKLKNRMRPNEIDDPPLGPGGRIGSSNYKYIAEKDLSTCIAFAALLQKDTRLTTGLRVSAWADTLIWITSFFPAPSGLRLDAFDHIVRHRVSMEEGAPWSVTPRCHGTSAYPSTKLPYQCALPVWHAASHNEDCKENNSLSFKPGVGKSDGEGVERVWSVLNPASYQTKDAGRGAEGRRSGGQESIAIISKEHRTRWRVSRKSVATVEHDVKKEWKAMIDAWLADPSQPNPYTLSRKDTTDCPDRSRGSVWKCKGTRTLCSLRAVRPYKGAARRRVLTAGLQIEVAQRRILTEIAGTALVTADREGKLHEWRRTLLVKIGTFRDLQRRFMPGAAHTIAQAEAARD